MRITLGLILALLLALVVTIFAVQNNASVDISFIAWKTTGSLALVLMITFALGILLGLLVSTPGSIKRRRQFADLKKQLQSLEKELEEAFKTTDLTPEESPALETSPEEKPEDTVDQEPDPSASLQT
jgi:putative membrane protein